MERLSLLVVVGLVAAVAGSIASAFMLTFSVAVYDELTKPLRYSITVLAPEKSAPADWNCLAETPDEGRSNTLSNT